MPSQRFPHVLSAVVVLSGMCVMGPAVAVADTSSQVDLVGPAGSVAFGEEVVVLPNGNIVVVDPLSSVGGPNAGAVHLFDGDTLELISTLVGTEVGDGVGSGGITVVGGSNFVVCSPGWRSEQVVGIHATGAATFVNGVSGLDGAVSATNSLVGPGASEFPLCGAGVTVLANGNYVVATATATADGWATWGSGATGVSGVVALGNSLHGPWQVVPLANGHYVATLTTAADATDLVTWGNGAGGTVGEATAANSREGHLTAASSVTALSDGSYVVTSPDSADTRGTVTWVSGAGPSSGPLTASHTLTGQASGSRIGSGGVVPVGNGNFVVRSHGNGLGSTVDFRAAGSGNATQGAVALTAGFAGCHFEEFLLVCSVVEPGNADVAALTNGNFVVLTGTDGGTQGDHLAATWGSGSAGVSGSLSWSDTISSHLQCFAGLVVGCDVGGQVTPLANGHYVVTNDAGALWWGDGTQPTSGASPSAVFNENRDGMGVPFVVTPLAGGDYLARWNQLEMGNSQGAGGTELSHVWYLDGDSPVAGTSWDQVDLNGGEVERGFSGASTAPTGEDVALPDGGYVSTFPYWNGDRGAVFRGSGSPAGAVLGGPAGLVGNPGDQVGFNAAGKAITVFSNSAFAVNSSLVDANGVVDAGAVTLVGPGGAGGTLTETNTVFGGVAGGGARLTVADRLLADGSVVVGRPAENIVTVLRPAYPTLAAVAPGRVLETRVGPLLVTVDGLHQGVGGLVAGGVYELPVVGRAGVPGSASAVVLNVTAVGGQARGYLTVFPCGSVRPNASSVNFGVGQTVANGVVARVGAGGKVCVFASAATDVVVDVNGYVPS